jgi:hypothetical protein
MGKKITIKKSSSADSAPKKVTKKTKTSESEEESAPQGLTAGASMGSLSLPGLTAEELEGAEEKPKKSKRAKAEEEEDPNAPRAEDGRLIKEIITVGGDDDDKEDLDEDDDSHTQEELDKMKKWWLEEPFRSLLDPNLAGTVQFSKYDLSKLINEFTDNMLKEDLIDFRISGIAINSSAKMYHWKITDVIKEEEVIEQKKEQERMRREIPKAISQPMREGRKLASADDLFAAMRIAIIDTMRKREVLRRRREKMEEKKEKKVQVRAKGKLPAEILKHITGSEETVEQRLNKWHQKIKEMVRLEERKDETISFEELRKVIWAADGEEYGKKIQYIQAFESLMFLASLNKIRLEQLHQRDPINITVTDKTPVDLR